MENAKMYYAVVERAKVSMGIGTLALYEAKFGNRPTYKAIEVAVKEGAALPGSLVDKWNCITGGSVIDDKEYGGLTPQLSWVMSEMIKGNHHPNPDKDGMTKANIYPVGLRKLAYHKRSLYGEYNDPFMIHMAGSSTGCIAVVKDDWLECMKVLNDAFKVCSFEIHVIEVEL